MIHPDTRVAEVDARIGVGVFATATIPRGTIVWCQDRFDRVFTRDEVAVLDAPHRRILERYAHLDARANFILCWDAGRLVNHHCDPSIRGLGANVMLAIRDIAPGEEITCDYAECNIDPALECRCGAPACRGRIHGRDLLTHCAAWDAEVLGTIPQARSVAQPLWAYLLEPELIGDLLSGRRPIPSMSTHCRFSPLSSTNLEVTQVDHP
jgi:hypothetical protein